ncbi:hypothetical protein D3C72_600520 [compost metagenome]
MRALEPVTVAVTIAAASSLSASWAVARLMASETGAPGRMSRSARRFARSTSSARMAMRTIVSTASSG